MLVYILLVHWYQENYIYGVYSKYEYAKNDMINALNSALEYKEKYKYRDEFRITMDDITIVEEMVDDMLKDIKDRSYNV